MKCWFIHTISVTLGWGVKIKHVSWEIAHLYIVPVQDCTCQGPVSVKPVCGVLSIKPPAAACNNLFMGSLCFRAPLQWYFKIQQNNNKKWHPTTNYNKRGNILIKRVNILITNRRSNIFISGVISSSGGAIFLWRQYSYQGRQYSYQLYNMRLQPYLENDVVGKRYAVEDFKSEILSTQAAWLSSRMRKYQGAWYLCQSKKLSRTLLGGEIFGF